MAGKGILDKLKKVNKGEQDKPGVLPLRAFYGREPMAESLRGRMYRQIEEVMNLPDGVGRGGHGNGIRYLWGSDALSIVDSNSSPLEYLVARGELEMKDVDEEGMGGARFHTALRFRDLMDGAQVKTIRSPSLDGMGGGGCATSAGDIRGYQLDCMKLIDKLKKGMPKPWLFQLLEALVWRDDWFDIKGGEAGERRRTIEALHFSIDRAAVSIGYMPEGDLTQRWPGGSPSLPPEVRRRILGSRASSPLELQTWQDARKV